jgi:hypothetical protein
MTKHDRLRQAADRLSEALILVEQHAARCRSPRDPERPRLELSMLKQSLETIRDLIETVLREGRTQ